MAWDTGYFIDWVLTTVSLLLYCTDTMSRLLISILAIAKSGIHQFIGSVLIQSHTPLCRNPVIQLIDCFNSLNSILIWTKYHMCPLNVGVVGRFSLNISRARSLWHIVWRYNYPMTNCCWCCYDIYACKIRDWLGGRLIDRIHLNDDLMGKRVTHEMYCSSPKCSCGIN